MAAAMIGESSAHGFGLSSKSAWRDIQRLHQLGIADRHSKCIDPPGHVLAGVRFEDIDCLCTHALYCAAWMLKSRASSLAIPEVRRGVPDPLCMASQSSAGVPRRAGAFRCMSGLAWSAWRARGESWVRESSIANCMPHLYRAKTSANDTVGSRGRPPIVLDHRCRDILTSIGRG